MKKWWLVSAIVLYSGIGILGLMGHAYTEETSLSKTADENLIFLIVGSIVIGGTFFYFFRKIFPNGYINQNQIARFFIPVLFIILSFALNRAWLQIINVVGRQQSLTIAGHIFSKSIEHSGKTDFYYLILVDSVTENRYKFRVKKSVFNQVGNKGDKISKDFLIGSLGIIYRSNL